MVRSDKQDMKVLLAIVVLVSVCPWSCLADYICVCNYKDSATVYSESDISSPVLGNLSSWECKQILNVEVSHQWIPLAYEHQVGYVEKDSKELLQMCDGSPPASDKITPSASPVTATTRPTTATSTTTSASPTTTTTTTTTTTQRPTTTTTTQRPTTTSTRPTTTTQTKTTGYHTSNAEYPADGNLDLCPPSLLTTRNIWHHAAGQFGNKCYAVGLKDMFSWELGNAACIGFGGNLVRIDDEKENEFLSAFVRRHNNRPVWIGLNDRKREGTYRWSPSGDPVTYTNWVPNHTTHTDPDHQNNEDCVVLDPNRGGRWDDVTCGTVHFIVCEYGLRWNPYSIFG